MGGVILYKRQELHVCAVQYKKEEIIREKKRILIDKYNNKEKKNKEKKMDTSEFITSLIAGQSILKQNLFSFNSNEINNR